MIEKLRLKVQAAAKTGTEVAVEMHFYVFYPVFQNPEVNSSFMSKRCFCVDIR